MDVGESKNLLLRRLSSDARARLARHFRRQNSRWAARTWESTFDFGEPS
jgi:hypothetical protein